MPYVTSAPDGRQTPGQRALAAGARWRGGGRAASPRARGAEFARSTDASSEPPSPPRRRQRRPPSERRAAPPMPSCSSRPTHESEARHRAGPTRRSHRRHASRAGLVVLSVVALATRRHRIGSLLGDDPTRASTTTTRAAVREDGLAARRQRDARASWRVRRAPMPRSRRSSGCSTAAPARAGRRRAARAAEPAAGGAERARTDKIVDGDERGGGPCIGASEGC